LQEDLYEADSKILKLFCIQSELLQLEPLSQESLAWLPQPEPLIP